jgi:hypothetical protein
MISPRPSTFFVPAFHRFIAIAALAMMLSGSTLLRAEEAPRIFSDLQEGVTYAREGNRLLLFLLVENFAEESEAILEAVNDELSTRGHEFAIVRCRTESADHRKLFEERFQQDPSKMPLGVIATADGKVVIGTNGKSPEGYRLMISAARVQGGLEKDPEKIAAIEAEIADGDESITNSIFGLRKKDVAEKMILLTESRTWTFANGSTIEAALLEAKGATGIFVLPDGSQKELNFNDFSDDEKAFLGRLLGGAK